MSLKVYKQKRNFKKTSEPAGEKRQSSGKFNNLYIIQKHAASHLHYDFRLELDGVLLSWAVPKGPCLDPSIKRLAMHVEDHPVEYGTFEGIIPQGEYGGGTVMLWDRGKWLCENENPKLAYKNGSLTFELQGEKLKGQWKLIRMNKNDKTWLLFKIKDEYAKPLKKYDITLEEPNSVLSHYTLDQITEKHTNVWNTKGISKRTNITIPNSMRSHLKISFYPEQIFPQLATLVNEPPVGKNWIHEIKLDGYRLIAFKKGKKVKLVTRNNNDWTKQFKLLADQISQLPVSNVILDGEVVVLDDKGRPNFQLLQNSIKDQELPFIYYFFDILFLDKYELMQIPLIQRKELLKKILISTPASNLRFSDHFIGSGKEVLKKACHLKLEGIVSKDATSNYYQKRTTCWLKTKCKHQQEFIIAGFSKPQGKRSYFGSLLLATYNPQKELIYHGNVGTGFTEASLKSIFAKLTKLKTNKMPFKKKPPGSSNFIWIKPKLIGEIEFTEWTRDGTLRHPSFKGLRTDKKPQEIKREIEVPTRKLSKKKLLSYKLTNPQKLLYPEDEITKKDVAHYYESVSDWILPYISNRPLTLVRCPQNYKNCFYQKHLNGMRPESIHGVMIKEKNKKDEYFFINDVAGLMSLVQASVLEMHPWGCLVDNIEYPDMIVFDLDPAPDVHWKEVVNAAFQFKDQLKKLKLKSFVKTTGGKGLHVVVPINSEYKWDEIKLFSHVLVDFIVSQYPDKYVSQMTKSKRSGKIYLDYLRNQRGATSIAPYSTRSRPQAPVATPVSWDELTKNFDDTFYTIKSLPKRLTVLKKDPWAEFYKLNQPLKLLKLKKEK